MEATRTSIEELKERVDKLGEVVENCKCQVEDFTKEKPLVALGVAFLVGIATGAIVAAAVSSRK